MCPLPCRQRRFHRVGAPTPWERARGVAGGLFFRSSGSSVAPLGSSEACTMWRAKGTRASLLMPPRMVRRLRDHGAKPAMTFGELELLAMSEMNTMPP